MTTWAGWEADLLKALGVPNTAESRAFLDSWTGAAPANCPNNPLLASKPESGSGDCAELTASRTAQAYRSHAQGINATVAELRSGNFPHLLAALESGHPLAVSDPGQVAADLAKWGVSHFANEYLALAQEQASSGGGPSAPAASHAHKGWGDIQHSVNRRLPTALNQASRYNRAALRALARRRRVRR